VGVFKGAVGNVGNRRLVFHVSQGPGISTALCSVSARAPSLDHCFHGLASSGRSSSSGSPTAWAALEQVAVVQQPVEHGATSGFNRGMDPSLRYGVE
jgi:hypothetical protein